MYLFSTHWKHEKTVRFSDVFSGYRKSALETSGLRSEFYIKLEYLNKFIQYFIDTSLPTSNVN